MSFQKVLVLTLVALGFALNAQADSLGSAAAEDQARLEQSFNQELLRLSDDQKSQLYQADAYIQRQLGFTDMKSSSQPLRKIGIICLNAKGGMLIAKASGSICRTGGDKPTFYVLGALGGGITTQWMAGAAIGIVESRSTNISGSYPVLSIGFSPGVSADVLFGRSEDFRKIFLIGAGVGFGIEITGGTLVLTPIFKEN